MTESAADSKSDERADGRENPFKRFVSHRTHTNEDLGVDHIFVKPEGQLSPEEQALELTRITLRSSPSTIGTVTTSVSTSAASSAT